MTDSINKNKSTLLKKEKRLALILLLPTILIVLSVVIFPLLANFWISFKPVSLGDLRPPKLILKERVKANLSDNSKLIEVHYRYRNSSIKYDLENVIIKDKIPSSFTVKNIQPSRFCKVNLKELICDLNKVSSKSSGKIILKIHKNDQWQKNLDNLKKTKPLVSFRSKNVIARSPGSKPAPRSIRLPRTFRAAGRGIGLGQGASAVRALRRSGLHSACTMLPSS